MAEKHKFTQAVSAITAWLGSVHAITAAVLMIGIWLVTGPFFDYSDTWQLIINTSTTIITFIMVFVIQNSQNRDSLAIQTKLDAVLDLVAEHTDQDLLRIEEKTEQEIQAKHEEVVKQSN